MAVIVVQNWFEERKRLALPEGFRVAYVEQSASHLFFRFHTREDLTMRHK